MSPKQIRVLQIFIILFLSSLTLYVLFQEAEKPIEETLILTEDPPTKESPIKSKEKPKEEKASQTRQKDSLELNENQKKALQQFERRAQEIQSKLPRKADLQKLEDDQVHSIPQELLQTGRQLGQLKEMVLRYPDNPVLQERAKEFYKNCADDEGYPTSIRSLCLFNRLQLAKNSGEDFDISPYPLEIKELVLQLNPFRQ